MARTSENVQSTLSRRDGRLAKISELVHQDASWLRLLSPVTDVYDLWDEHRSKISQGSTSFWVDPYTSSEERLWQHERFGNYLYGSILSLYFSRHSTLRARYDSFNSSKMVSRFFHSVFAALDSVACCVWLVETPGEYKKLRSVGWEGIPSNYDAHQLISDPDLKLSSAFRNLLTHRPFWQFAVNRTTGDFFLPNDPHRLDSATKAAQDYMQETFFEFSSRVLNKIVEKLGPSYEELFRQYRSRV